MNDSELLVVIVTAAVVIPAVLVWLLRRGRTAPGVAEGVAPVAFASVAPAPAPASVTAKNLGKLEVTAIHHGVAGEEGEWVMVVSEDYEPVQLEGWKLTDEGAKHTYVFPAVTIPPSGRLRIHMWVGVDDGDDLYVGRRQHWWNNDGDTAYLYDAQGTLVHSHHYGATPAEA